MNNIRWLVLVDAAFQGPEPLIECYHSFAAAAVRAAHMYSMFFPYISDLAVTVVEVGV